MRPPTRADHLGRRILKWSLLIALGPMLLLAAQGYHCARAAVLDATQERLSQLTASRKARIELWLAERLADAAFLAACPSVRNRSLANTPTESEAGETSEYLSLLANKNGIYEAIALYDLTWRELASTGTEDHGLAGFGMSEIQESVESSPGPAVGKIHRHEDHRIGIHFGAPVLGAEHQPRAYVLTAVDESALLTILTGGLGSATTGRCYLTSLDGLILTDPHGSDGETMFAGRIRTTGFQRALGGATGAAVYDDYLGREVVGGFATIPAMGWVLLIEQDSADALSWLPRLGWRAGITALLVMVLVMLLAFHASRRMTAPLQRLAAVAHEVARGAHDARVGSVAEPEVDAVGQALNHMLDELASARHRLVHHATLAALGEMSSAVVHEMRNPLSSIKLNLQAMHTKFRDDPTHGELARIALEQVKRLEGMFTDLLSLSRPLTMNAHVMELRVALDAALEAVAEKARERHCRFRIDDNAPGARVSLDPERFGQALVNLLQNALEAIGDDGEIILRTSFDAAKGRVLLEILDSGPGIPEDNLERLFQPFFTTKADGTGLGLAIVRKNIEYHGGQVTARNRSDSQAVQRGAAFRIELPLETNQLAGIA